MLVSSTAVFSFDGVKRQSWKLPSSISWMSSSAMVSSMACTKPSSVVPIALAMLPFPSASDENDLDSLAAGEDTCAFSSTALSTAGVVVGLAVISPLDGSCTASFGSLATLGSAAAPPSNVSDANPTAPSLFPSNIEPPPPPLPSVRYTAADSITPPPSWTFLTKSQTSPLALSHMPVMSPIVPERSRRCFFIQRFCMRRSPA